MPKYTFTAEITYSGATLIVSADSMDEARQKVEAGEWDNDDVTGASLSDWEIGEGRLDE